MDITKHESSSPDARAARLKRLRNMANLSKKDLCEQGEININTLIGWEVARYGGLPQKGAEKVLVALSKSGIQCSTEWLMHGVGKGPSLLTDFDAATQESMDNTERVSTDEEDQKIIEELLVFKKHYKNAADLCVADDGMSPFYLLGDYVAGIKRFKKDIETTIGLNCIVRLDDGTILLRRLRKGSKPDLYSLYCINNETSAEPNLNNIVLVSAAPVIWFRRKDSGSVRVD